MVPPDNTTETPAAKAATSANNTVATASTRANNGTRDERPSPQRARPSHPTATARHP